jgi:hypothetical protein
MPRQKQDKVKKANEKATEEVIGNMKETDSGISSIREKVDEIHRVISQPPPVPEKKPRVKRVLSEEQKASLRERLIKARQVKADKKKIIE